MLGRRFWASEHFGSKDLRANVDNWTNSNPLYQLNNQDPFIHYFYNSMLAFLVTNIAASAFAERCRMSVYVLFAILMSGKIKEMIRLLLQNCSSYRICLSISCTLDVEWQWLAWCHC